MKVVIQRALNADVVINNKQVGKIDKGYVLLVGFKENDDENIVNKMCEKIINMRIFEDTSSKMNLALKDINGSILSISQFTLYAKHSGRRPSFAHAMKYDDASRLYDYFNNKLESYDVKVEKGIFGEDMKVSLTNDGPVTIIVDSDIDF